MKKFKITLRTTKNSQGWPENNNEKIFNLLELDFFADSDKNAENLLKVLEDTYTRPAGIMTSPFTLEEITE